MKIVLIQCNWKYHDPLYPNLGSVKPYQPIELCYIAALLKLKHEVSIIDAFKNDLTMLELTKKVADLNPEIVIINTANNYLFWRCCFPDIDVVAKTIKSLKRLRTLQNLKTIVIGPHATVEPDWTLKNSGADYVIRGEPELAINDFINSGLINLQIDGVFNKSAKENKLASVEIDKLLPPAYELLDLDNYGCHTWINDQEFNFQKGVLLEYSRGCKYFCEFCFRHGFREKYRFKPARQIIEEIKCLIEIYSIEYIFFIDDIFNIDNLNFRDFLSRLKDLKIAYGCQCRPDIMTNELIDLMAESGCVYIEYGLESLNTENRKRLKKNQELIKVMRLINYTKSKIKFVVHNLLDFTTLEKILNSKAIVNRNEGDSLLNITTETNALETIILFPKTIMAERIQKQLKIKKFGFEETIRLYWLSSVVKMIKNLKAYHVLIWRFICLNMPFNILKFLIRFWIKSKPLPQTLARELKENEYRKI